MLEHVDRMQLAVRDCAAAAETFAHIFDAETVREDEVAHYNAKRRVLHAGTSEFELLEPKGDGAVADYIADWGEGLFAAGFSTKDVGALASRLTSKGVQYVDAGDQLLIAPDQTPGLRMVISPESPRPMVGLMRYLYEATNLVNDHVAAAAFYADRFGLDQSRFSPLTSHDYGYTGQLTLFNPPERLDRIELSQITDSNQPMGRFMARRGGETLYMCYIEVEAIAPIAERMKAKGLRHTAGGEHSESGTNMFIHPTALHGVLMGVSRTNWAWTWSGRPELAGASAGTSH
jgi:4-hydroxyphenylpyruvate dioxygenase-like putative hemolysin